MPRKKRKPAHDMADRVDAVRLRAGLLLTEFRQRLIEDGTYEVSYQSVQNYHHDRPAPITYLVRVAEVFKADFTYLATGRRYEPAFGPPTSFRKGEGHFGPDPKEGDRQAEQQDWQEVHTLTAEEAITFATERTNFFAPLLQAAGGVRVDSLSTLVDRVRRIAGRKGMMDPEPEGNLMPGHYAAPSEYEERLSAVLQSYQMFDELFGRAWKGMREIVAHEFGAEAGKSFTLHQQLRFADGLMVVLRGLFPDYGEPAIRKTDDD